MRAKHRFLFIEDQEDDTLLLVRRLQSAGFVFDWKRIDTEQALEAALHEAWDMVFSDYTMPWFNGIKALEIVRQSDPHLPFIMVSGTIGEETAVEAMRRGAQDFIMKGNIKRLIPAVERELQKQEDYRRHRETERQRTRFSEILRMTPDLLAIFNKDGFIEYMNDAGKKFTGMTFESSLTRRNIIDIFPGSYKRRFKSEILPCVLHDELWSGELELLVGPDALLPFSSVILAHRDAGGEIDYLSIIARDISERKLLEEKLQYKANHDNLTDLPNRYFFADRFTTELQRARRNSTCVGVLFLDLDNFKRINDSLGHEAGDALLQDVARRFRNAVRPNDTVARIGGDEFTVLTGDLGTPESILAILQRLKKSFTAPILLNSHEVFITFSAGIALYPHDGDNVTDLLRNADVAMYKAKGRGANQYCFYSSEMNERSHELLSLEASLQRALDRDEFVLHYQPQINLHTGEICGLEALLRWKHPDRGLVPPAEFIPILENNGLIIQVGEWVLRQACRDYQRIQESVRKRTRIAINVSAVQFNDDSFFDSVRLTLQEENTPATAIELEITENILMQNPQRNVEILNSLTSLGVQVAIDDFGTGYSSLTYLKRFPLHVLKIDKSFISEIEIDHNNSVIVEASISLGKKMGMEVVAEGVETSEQLNFLKRNKCDTAQGFYFSKPLPLSQLMLYMEKSRLN